MSITSADVVGCAAKNHFGIGGPRDTIGGMEPGVPTELGAEKVLSTARVERGSATGRTRYVRHGAESYNPEIRYLAITQPSDESSWVFLFHCDEDWNIIWDDYLESAEDALHQARWAYGDDVRFAGLCEPPDVRDRNA